MLLHNLSSDVLESVVRQLLPSAVSHLVCSCKALHVSATPRLDDWALLWELLEKDGGWDDACRSAAGEGRVQALRWAHALGCPWDGNTIQAPCSWNARTSSRLANGGNLEALQWARAQSPPAPWDDGTCASAASGGQLHVLKWLRAQTPPCPWSHTTCSEAAFEGHIELLAWARSQSPPAPWSDRTTLAAVAGVSLETLVWLRSQGCNWDEEECLELLRGEVDVVDDADFYDDDIEQSPRLRELRDGGNPAYFFLLSWVEAEAGYAPAWRTLMHAEASFEAA